MQFECIRSERGGGWAVEAIDYAHDGSISRVLFTGLNAEELAKEYAAWKNASSEPRPERPQRRIEV